MALGESCGLPGAAAGICAGLNHVAQLGDHQAHPDTEHGHSDGESSRGFPLGEFGR
jgi:hypothetical protein